jgi:hypothetical protein
MSSKRKARNHPGSDLVAVVSIAEEPWQAAGSPDDVEAWLGTLDHDQVNQVMRQTEVTRDEFLRRMAVFPDLVRQVSTAEGLFIMLIEPNGLRQWWDSAADKT